MNTNEKKPATVDNFRREYAEALVRMVEKHPEQYAYPASDIPRVVEKMLAGMAKGEASIGPAAKAAARKCGIRPTVGAIRAFLSGGAS